jgi:hypothetical protein
VSNALVVFTRKGTRIKDQRLEWIPKEHTPSRAEARREYFFAVMDSSERKETERYSRVVVVVESKERTAARVERWTLF